MLRSIARIFLTTYRSLLLQILLLTSLQLVIIPAAVPQRPSFSLKEASKTLPHISGKTADADYLYTTAGNRLYCIGSQGGGFPEVGFHVPGEMGGIWQQPIKLMNGFSFDIKDGASGKSLTVIPEQFTSFSFTSQFNYTVAGPHIHITQTQFVPDNLPVLVVEYTIQNKGTMAEKIQFDLNAVVNLLPVWLAERINLQDGRDTLLYTDNTKNIRLFKDGLNDWYAGIGVENSSARFGKLSRPAGKPNSIATTIVVPVNITAGATQTIRFYISGSTSTAREVVSNVGLVKSQLAVLFDQKKKRFSQLEQTASVRVPDSLLQTAYNWGKYATDWLQRDVPGLGKGLSAGLPDYPWFFSNDQAATFMALTGTIQPQLFYNSFRFLKAVSDKTNNNSGQIIHEVSDNGVVFNKGNMQESQLHIIAAWQIFQWTGNLQFLKENYAFAKRTWAWLQQHDTNHNGYIEGYGGVEIEGLDDEMLDVQINTYRFLDVLSQMAKMFKDTASSTTYAAKAAQLKQNINKDWWVESEHCYADFLTTKEKALHIIDDALQKRVKPERNRWAQEKLAALKASVVNNTYTSNGYLVYYNASILDPATEGMVDTARALQMIERASFFTNKFGTYIAGIERPDDVSTDERPFQKDSTFTYNRAVMPAGSSGLIQAAARYGLPDTALQYIHQTLNTFSYATPGTTYEVSPDYGMFVQAWNISCINIPLIQYFFGVQPEAYKKEITIHLQMPGDWKNASLKNLLVGDSKFSIDYLKENNRVTCVIHSSSPGWKIHFVTDHAGDPVTVNQKKMTASAAAIELTGTTNTIQYTTGN